MAEQGDSVLDYPAPGPWSSHGACRQLQGDYERLVAETDPSAAGDQLRTEATRMVHALFFPDSGSVSAALRVCERCPVLAQCREYSLDCPDALAGIWGGMGPTERRRARLARRSA